MRIDLGAKVRTNDGQDAGTIERVIVDPSTKDVTAFVLSTGGLLGRQVLLHRDELGDRTADGDAIRLTATKADLDGRPDFDASRYTTPPEVGEAPFGYPYSALLWPIDEAEPVVMPPRTRQPQIDRGTPVVDRDAHEVGVVEDVRFHSETGELAGLTIRAGGLIETSFGGGATRELPASEVAGFEGGSVRLKLTKAEVEQRLSAAERARRRA